MNQRINLFSEQDQRQILIDGQFILSELAHDLDVAPTDRVKAAAELVKSAGQQVKWEAQNAREQEMHDARLPIIKALSDNLVGRGGGEVRLPLYDAELPDQISAIHKLS